MIDTAEVSFYFLKNLVTDLKEIRNISKLDLLLSDSLNRHLTNLINTISREIPDLEPTPEIRYNEKNQLEQLWVSKSGLYRHSQHWQPINKY